MHVLVPMDNSEQSWGAFEHAAEQFPGATIRCLRVIDPVAGGYGGDLGAYPGNQWMETQEELAEDMFQEVRERAEAAGVEVETVTDVGMPARTITEAADDCDHVVIGSHGRDGLSRILLGSVAETVVRRSPVPVTVVR